MRGPHLYFHVCAHFVPAARMLPPLGRPKLQRMAPESEISPARRPSLSRLFKNSVHVGCAASWFWSQTVPEERLKFWAGASTRPWVPFWAHGFAVAAAGFHLPTLYSFLSPWTTPLSWDLPIPSLHLTMSSSKALCCPISFPDCHLSQSPFSQASETGVGGSQGLRSGQPSHVQRLCWGLEEETGPPCARDKGTDVG